MINSHATHCLTANCYICQHAWHSYRMFMLRKMYNTFLCCHVYSASYWWWRRGVAIFLDCMFHVIVCIYRSICFSLDDSTSEVTPVQVALSSQAVPTDTVPSPASTPTLSALSNVVDAPEHPSPCPNPVTDVPVHDAPSSHRAALGQPPPPPPLSWWCAHSWCPLMPAGCTWASIIASFGCSILSGALSRYLITRAAHTRASLPLTRQHAHLGFPVRCAHSWCLLSPASCTWASLTLCHWCAYSWSPCWVPRSPTIWDWPQQPPANASTVSRSPTITGAVPRSPTITGTVPRSPTIAGTVPRSLAIAGTVPRSPTIAGTVWRSPTIAGTIIWRSPAITGWFPWVPTPADRAPDPFICPPRRPQSRISWELRFSLDPHRSNW